LKFLNVNFFFILNCLICFNNFVFSPRAIVASFGVNKLSIIEDKKIDQPINQLNTCSKNLDRNNEAVLKEKLVLCEENIKKLKEKITKMEEDLNEFSDENRNLKRKNKLLEDENKTMLRLIKARGFE